MDTAAEIEKRRLVNLISIIQDSNLIHELLLTVENKAKGLPSEKKSKRRAGSGKHLIKYIAADFDAPLDDMFKDYMPS